MSPLQTWQGIDQKKNKLIGHGKSRNGTDGQVNPTYASRKQDKWLGEASNGTDRSGYTPKDAAEEHEIME